MTSLLRCIKKRDAKILFRRVQNFFSTANMSINEFKNHSVDDENLFTQEEILDLAKIISDDQSVRVLDYHLVDCSKETGGFMSSRTSLKVTFQKSQDSPTTVNAFVKSLPKQCETYDGFVYETAFRQESFFFDKILPQLLHDYKSEKWCPDHYFKTENSVIMEDLKCSGYRMLAKLINDLQILKSSLATIARFHSCSILAEARLSRESKCQVTLNKYFNNTMEEQLFVRDGKNSEWYRSGINVACSVGERLGYNTEKIREVFNRVFDMIVPSDTHQNVICHGDLHTRNIMFDDNDATPMNSVLVDFQLIRYAPMVTDILHFLHMNTSAKFREDNEEELIKFYHSVLVDTIKIHDPSIEPPTLSSIHEGLQEYRVYGYIVACAYMPLIMLASKNGARILGNFELLHNFFFVDRLKDVLDYMEIDEIFKARVENTVEELVRNAIR